MGKLNNLGTVAKQAITGDFGKAFGKTIASHLEDPKIGKAFGIAAEGLFNAGIGTVGGAAGGAVIGGIAGAIDEKSSVGEGMSRGALTGAGLGMLAGGVGITGYGHRDRIMAISNDIATRTTENVGAIKDEINARQKQSQAAAGWAAEGRTL
jgi:hypothetical protein